MDEYTRTLVGDIKRRNSKSLTELKEHRDILFSAGRDAEADELTPLIKELGQTYVIIADFLSKDAS